MLTLSLNEQKSGSNFDRRRRLGTTRASDIWSLGCLFYELLASEYLYQGLELPQLFTIFTNKDHPLISAQKKEKLVPELSPTSSPLQTASNPREIASKLIDFLSWILVRNHMHRPTIEHVTRKYDTLLKELSIMDPRIAEGSAINLPNSLALHSESQRLTPAQRDKQRFEDLCMTVDELLAEGGLLSRPGSLKSPINITKIGQISSSSNKSFSPDFMLILRQVALCSEAYFDRNTTKLISKGFTHLVTFNGLVGQEKLSQFVSLQLRYFEDETPKQNLFRHIPKIFDFMRAVRLHKGKLLFIEPVGASKKVISRLGAGGRAAGTQNNSPAFLKQCILYILATLFKCSIYEIWSLINTQLVFFHLPVGDLQWLSTLIDIQKRLRTVSCGFERASCLCGCCVFLIKSKVIRPVLEEYYGLKGETGGLRGSSGGGGIMGGSAAERGAGLASGESEADLEAAACRRKVKRCRCSRVRQTNLVTECPSDGCLEYIKFLKVRKPF